MIENAQVVILVGALAGLLRNVAGWIENSYKDGIASSYEWKQLLATVIQYVGQTAILFLGINQVVDSNNAAAGISASVVFLLDKYFKNR